MNDSIYPLFLFALNNIGTPSLTPSRLYYLIIKESQVTLYYFIPVVRNSDNKPGMYDLVNFSILTQEQESLLMGGN